MEPTTAMLAAQAGGSLIKGIGGYKSGKGASKAAIATASYNRSLAELSASNVRSAGKLEFARDSLFAQQELDVGLYNADLLLHRAEGVELQTDFERGLNYRDSVKIIGEMKSSIGASGVTFAGSPAMQIAMAEYDMEVADSSILARGLVAKNNLENAYNMAQWAAKNKYNVSLSDANMKKWNTDVNAANIVNQGQADYYSGKLKASTAKAQGTNALIGGIMGAGIQATAASKIG